MAPPGWNTASQIENHELAASIINGHGNEEYAVFDDENLEQLKRFILDPSITKRDEMLKEKDWVDEQGQRPGSKAAERDGNLVGFLVARHGTDDPAFDERDIELLREWFEEGMPVGK